jgi:hypothetical protein
LPRIFLASEPRSGRGGQDAGGVEPSDLLRAVASLCTPGHDVGPDHARRMVVLLIDGLRY